MRAGGLSRSGIPEDMRVIDISNLSGDPVYEGLAGAFEIDLEIARLQRVVTSLTTQRMELINDAIESGKMVQENTQGNRFVLKQVEKTSRTLDEDLLFKKHPGVFKEIAKPVFKVSIADAKGLLSENEITACSNIKTTTSWKLEFELKRPFVPGVD